MKLVLTLSLLALLTACGNTKSKSNTNSVVSLSAQPSLALCNKSNDSNFSFNTAAVLDQNGLTNPDWLKMKFNFINSNITKSGNVIRFFKWKVVNGQSVLDQTPLNVASYDFSSGQATSNLTNTIPADQINGQFGIYIQLNDPTLAYQVLKVVAYDSTGAVIGNINSLMPTFYANPGEYAFNSDGTARSVSLQQLHPLYGTNTGYNAAQFKQYFDQYCF